MSHSHRTMLTIHNLSIQYGERCGVEDFSLLVERGEILALVGPTGCGKSSVLRAVAGLIEPDGGEIAIEGVCAAGAKWVPPEKRHTGLVFQDFALFPHLSVEDNIGFRVKDRADADIWIQTLGLENMRQAMPATLSGGQKQRVALARSLAHRPKLLLLDEPLSNLDAALKSGLRGEIREAVKRAGVTAVWVTHDQAEAMAVGDRVAVMRAGRMEQAGTPEECYENPATRFVAGFFGEGFFLHGRRRAGGLETFLGDHPAATRNTGACGEEVDVLVRPHDIGLSRTERSNAVVEGHRYEGETRRYALALDSKELIQARLDHAQRFQPGERVLASVSAVHPLAAFPRQDATARPDV